MNRLVYILTGVSFLLVIVVCILASKRPEEPVNESKYRDEMRVELDVLKSEIRDIKRNLIEQYEKDDTVTTSSGAINSNEDFIRRTNGKLPPGHPDR